MPNLKITSDCMNSIWMFLQTMVLVLYCSFIMWNLIYFLKILTWCMFDILVHHIHNVRHVEMDIIGIVCIWYPIYCGTFVTSLQNQGWYSGKLVIFHLNYHQKIAIVIIIDLHLFVVALITSMHEWVPNCNGTQLPPPF